MRGERREADRLMKKVAESKVLIKESGKRHVSRIRHTLPEEKTHLA